MTLTPEQAALVQKLLGQGKFVGGIGVFEQCQVSQAAAAEIAAQAGEVRAAITLIDAKTSEIERLTKALEAIADGDDDPAVMARQTLAAIAARHPNQERDNG